MDPPAVGAFTVGSLVTRLTALSNVSSFVPLLSFDEDGHGHCLCDDIAGVTLLLGSRVTVCAEVSPLVLLLLLFL